MCRVCVLLNLQYSHPHANANVVPTGASKAQQSGSFVSYNYCILRQNGQGERSKANGHAIALGSLMTGASADWCRGSRKSTVRHHGVTSCACAERQRKCAPMHREECASAQ